MTLDLQKDLDELVMQHWSLVHDLRGRADRLRREVLEASRKLVEQRLDRDRFPEPQFEQNASQWWLGWRQGKTLVASVQVGVPERLACFGLEVFTAFGTYSSYRAIKSAAEEQFGKRFAGQWVPSLQTTRTVVAELRAEGGDVEDLIERAANEVVRQLEVAEFLARFPREVVAV